VGHPLTPTDLLLAWGQGEAEAFDRLVPLVYDELHRLARRYLARERPGHGMQTTALLNEAYLRLIEGEAGALAESGTLFRDGGESDAPHSRRRGAPNQPLPSTFQRLGKPSGPSSTCSEAPTRSSRLDPGKTSEPPH
jgi:hypothetical protein